MSPKVRTILTAVVAAFAALVVVLPTLGAPVWIAAIIGVVLAGCAAVGIVPPQVGGTQQGLVSPSVTEPPAADIEEAPVDGPVHTGGLG